MTTATTATAPSESAKLRCSILLCFRSIPASSSEFNICESELAGSCGRGLIGVRPRRLFNRLGDISRQVVSCPHIAAEEADLTGHGSLQNNVAITCDELTAHR